MFFTLVFAERSYPARWMADETARIRAGLHAAGCRAGDTVAAMLRNGPAFVALVLACRQAGVYLVSINWHFKAAEAGYLLVDSGARWLVVHDDLIEQVRDGLPPGTLVVAVAADETVDAPPASHLPPPPSPSPPPTAMLPWPRFGIDAAPAPPAVGLTHGTIAYTSGTTGKPKGVRRLAAPAERAATMQTDLQRINETVFGVSRTSDVALLCAPIYHSAPMSYLLHCCAMQATLVLENGFRAERALALIERHRITHAYLVPTMYQRLLALDAEVRSQFDIASLRQVGSTGSPCAPQLKRDMMEWFGPVITEAYASSETGYITFIDAASWLARPGSVGQALFDAKISIRDERGRELPTGETGVIYARQPATPDFTYLNKPEAREAVEADGLVTLGDMGFLDDDGFLYVCDRSADMVISGGVNIYPAEIELVLQEMHGVADCAVFGIPDDEFGEALAAAVQLEAGSTVEPAEMQAFVRARLANYKVPRTITLHDALPREDTGKIFKRLLREPYWVGKTRRI